MVNKCRFYITMPAVNIMLLSVWRRIWTASASWYIWIYWSSCRGKNYTQIIVATRIKALYLFTIFLWWCTCVHDDDRDNKFRWYRPNILNVDKTARRAARFVVARVAFTLESRRRKSLWNLMQLRERAAHCTRIPKSFFGGFTRMFVEISIRHNGFHVDSFRFASSRYIRFALSKNRLTGSNPMRRTDISPIGHSFCASSFRAPERPSKSTRGWNFARQIGGKKRADAPRSCTTSMKRTPRCSSFQ